MYAYIQSDFTSNTEHLATDSLSKDNSSQIRTGNADIWENALRV